MQVKLIWITPNAEAHIAYCARVSNPKNQTNPDYVKLLKYCIENQHWSVFQMANMCLEIETSRAISAQIIRHKSFEFQEMSQRYLEVQDLESIELRQQDTKNRQNSFDTLSDTLKNYYYPIIENLQKETLRIYHAMVADGVARETARFILPLNSRSRLYMNGNIRSWIHYIQVRTDPSTQKEHRLVAEECKKIFIENLPIISASLGWKSEFAK